MIYPKHIALIPDGSRTWAREQGLAQIEGHLAGQENAIKLVRYIFDTTDIDVLTLWGLSSENGLKRSSEELSYLFDIFRISDDFRKELYRNKINFRRIGNPKGLPRNLLDHLKKVTEELTFQESKKHLVFAINYGGRDEILRGIQKFYQQNGSENIGTITQEEFSKYLDLGDLPSVDLIIRTKANEARRLSGFMLWWIGYAELYFTDIKFPAFIPSELQKALDWFASIASKRNFGK